MSVIPLTLAISLCLVITFVVFFLREHARSRLSSPERDSLLPFAEETSGAHATEAPAMVISFKGKVPTRRHDHDGACSSNKPDHERCPDCRSRSKS